MKFLLALLFPVVLTGCPTTTSNDRPPAPPLPPDTNLCAQMCNHLLDLGCEEGKPVYNSDKPGPVDVPNQSCEEFCEELQGNGVAVNPRCVSTVSTCEQIEEFRQKPSSSCGGR